MTFKLSELNEFEFISFIFQWNKFVYLQEHIILCAGESSRR